MLGHAQGEDRGEHKGPVGLTSSMRHGYGALRVLLRVGRGPRDRTISEADVLKLMLVTSISE